MAYKRYIDRLGARLVDLGITPQVDAAGNLIATLPGEGRPLVLNAHMDRVPPGRGHQPVIRGGIMYSDGNTNLGAADLGNNGPWGRYFTVGVHKSFGTRRW